jgi:hypothetical protein
LPAAARRPCASRDAGDSFHTSRDVRSTVNNQEVTGAVSSEAGPLLSPRPRSGRGAGEKVKPCRDVVPARLYPLPCPSPAVAGEGRLTPWLAGAWQLAGSSTTALRKPRRWRFVSYVAGRAKHGEQPGRNWTSSSEAGPSPSPLPPCGRGEADALVGESQVTCRQHTAALRKSRRWGVVSCVAGRAKDGEQLERNWITSSEAGPPTSPRPRSGRGAGVRAEANRGGIAACLGPHPLFRCPRRGKADTVAGGSTAARRRRHPGAAQAAALGCRLQPHCLRRSREARRTTPTNVPESLVFPEGRPVASTRLRRGLLAHVRTVVIPARTAAGSGEQGRS